MSMSRGMISAPGGSVVECGFTLSGLSLLMESERGRFRRARYGVQMCECDE